jgi:hypothetical protein
MSLLAFLYALIFQMTGTDLQGNAWGDKVLDLTAQNVLFIQHVLGWILLALVVICVVIVIASALSGHEPFGSLGCFGTLAGWVGSIWLIGWVHVLVVNFLANNFNAIVGPTNPGFYIVLIVYVLLCWS